jgi:predicted  nucleic acid-binding Zn-ribbon protein
VGLNLDMLDTIEKLLILQDRDRKIRQLKGELAHIEPERQALKAKTAAAQTALETAKTRVKKIESDRKDLELEVEAKKQLISKYANQQFQTRKNEEYRALAHEIDMCKEAIFKIEDQELELMEQGEAAQKEVQRATQAANDARKLMEEQVSQLADREQNLKKELEELEANREELATAVGEGGRARYERLVRSKGQNVVVGVQHGVCGGCHMKLPPQVLVMCQAQQELVSCSNCGRILYYTRDMDLVGAE